MKQTLENLTTKKYDDMTTNKAKWQMECIEKYRRENDYSMLPIEFGNMEFDSRLYTAIEVLYWEYPNIPEHQKYQVVMDVFTNLKVAHHMPIKMILDMKKYRPDYILEPLKELADPDGNITIYHGTSVKEEKPHLSVSWTLNRERAEFYARDYWLSRGRAMSESQVEFYYIYTGTININNVIYYTNRRQDFEIVQHGKVKNIIEEETKREKPVKSMWG